MDWSKGFTATYYAKRIDPATWRDIEMINVTGGSIKRESSGLRQSADIDCQKYHIEMEQWIRVYLDVSQEGDFEHEALFTGLAMTPEDDIDGRRVSNRLECYSVLKPAEDVPLLRGWYAPAGANGGTVIKELLSTTPAPIEVEPDAPTLKNDLIAMDNENRLTMAERVLETIGWSIRIDGYGTIHVGPPSAEATAAFDPIENDVIETRIKITQDWYKAPNVYMAILDDMMAVARDDNPASPLSTISRGREVWEVDTSCDLCGSESIGSYATRMLIKAQQAQKTADYARRYFPDLYPGDLVRLHYPEQNLDGVFEVESQDIQLGHGARTSEKVSTYLTTDSLKEDEIKTGFFYLATADGDYLADSDGNYLVGLGRI